MATSGRLLSSGSRILPKFRQAGKLKLAQGVTTVGVQKFRHLHTSEPFTTKTLPKAQYGGRHTVTLLTGDGVGPELLGHVKQIFRYAAVPVDFEEITLNKNSTETEYDNAILAVKRNGVAIKGNIETSAEQYADLSMNVEIRAELDLFANIVCCKSIPGIPSRHSGIDLVIFRENTEGEYSSLEHESVDGVVESLKIITEMKSMRIAEYAFNYAARHGRKKVTAVHKANIMKLADGLFLECCRKVSEGYPDIEFEGMIVDNCSMQLVSRPQQFDVMVLPNLYGNIIANIAAGLVGGAGVTSGSNVGHQYAIFETGTRNTGKGIVGKNLANPSGMLLAGADMLAHLGLYEHEELIRETVAEVLSIDKVHTPDVGGQSMASDFMQAMIARLQAKNKWY